MTPHQKRVVEEKSSLDDKVEKLGAFIETNPLFADVPADEKKRLRDQLVFMLAYSSVLGERIENFKD